MHSVWRARRLGAVALLALAATGCGGQHTVVKTVTVTSARRTDVPSDSSEPGLRPSFKAEVRRMRLWGSGSGRSRLQLS
jgi:hypothetical protein